MGIRQFHNSARFHRSKREREAPEYPPSKQVSRSDRVSDRADRECSLKRTTRRARLRRRAPRKIRPRPNVNAKLAHFGTVINRRTLSLSLSLSRWRTRRGINRCPIRTRSTSASLSLGNGPLCGKSAYFCVELGAGRDRVHGEVAQVEVAVLVLHHLDLNTHPRSVTDTALERRVVFFPSETLSLSRERVRVFEKRERERERDPRVSKRVLWLSLFRRECYACDACLTLGRSVRLLVSWPGSRRS